MIEAPEPKLPPIMVRYTDNLKDQIAEISNQFEDDVRIMLTGEQMKIFPANSDIHRDITKYLTDGENEFYVITPKNQRPLKAVLKGLPVSYSADEIATGLAELGLKIDQVRQLTNLKTKAPVPVWQIVYRKAPENSKIFEKQTCQRLQIIYDIPLGEKIVTPRDNQNYAKSETQVVSSYFKSKSKI
ncbi:nucleic-acid-binding protein from transposon X-element [Caerostris extrusa]|uniref:Nucleic-acid-binding protein from transposon X-element n=1 Tax=Caerostris extrusa TaxID=172846 RepID=A0AAV4THE9_CAEEX|nr:nucleic-acid-binding protein from transposon X-element [Caerostris extrusa]